MMSKLVKFEGLMAPVFTPFDSCKRVEYDLIENYALFLKSKGITAILVNGTTGEGTTLDLKERKRVTEVWSTMCRKLDILLMVQISGCAFVDVIELAEHACQLNVDGVLCLPELYFKPKTVDKLVEYLKDIAHFLPNIPLYYYHIPMFTGVDLSMEHFMKVAKAVIPTFAGIKYTSGELDKALACLKLGQVFLGSEVLLCPAFAAGFNCAIMTSLNMIPETSEAIIRHIKNGEVEKAREQQQIICDFVEKTLEEGNGEWVYSMKVAFNKQFKHMSMGLPRKPF